MTNNILSFILVALLAVSVLGLSACGPNDYTLSTSCSPSDGGSVSPNSGVFDPDTEVIVTSSPGPGYRFDHWEGDASGTSATLNVVMDADKELTAHFTKTRTLSASASPSEGGSISPGSGAYDHGSDVSLTAIAANCYTFDYWSGAATGSVNPLTITMNTDQALVAHFTMDVYVLSANVSPTGGGSVSPIAGTYDCGTEVALTATPTIGYRFDRWEGDASGTSTTLNLLMDADKTVTAHFTKVYTLSVSTSPPDGGTVTPNSGTYDAGTQVALTAIPVCPYAFNAWIGTDMNATNPTTVLMDQDKAVTAFYRPLTPHMYEVVDGKLVSKYGEQTLFEMQLQSGDCVEGSLWLRWYYLTGAIEDPDGNVVVDYPDKRHEVHFDFRAEKTGKYRFKVYTTPGSINRDFYTLRYTIYS